MVLGFPRVGVVESIRLVGRVPGLKGFDRMEQPVNWTSPPAKWV